MLPLRLRTCAAVLLIALIGACALAGPAAAANKPYSVVVPSSVAGGPGVVLEVTFKNLSSPQHIGSANLTVLNVPAAFSVVSASVPAPGTGNATVSGNVVQLRNLDIPPGEQLKVTITANVPCAAGSFAWSVIAKQANDFSGPPGNDFGPQVNSPLTTSVTADCAAALLFVGQPATAGVNQAITTSLGGPVTVEVVDSTGKRLTTSSAEIRMSLDPVSGTGVLNGTNVATAVSGLATFANLSIDARGTYALVASSSGLTPATSDGFGVADAATVCAENESCSAMLSNANATFDVTAQGNAQTDAGVLTVNSNLGDDAVDCNGYDELSQGDFAVDFVPNPGSTGRAKVATLTIDKKTMNEQPENGAAFLNMCFAAPFPFTVKPGTPPSPDQFGLHVGLLPDCGTPPCVSKRNKTQAGQGVIQAMAPGGGDDPRYSG